jgi:hypothetical protein
MAQAERWRFAGIERCTEQHAVADHRLTTKEINMKNINMWGQGKTKKEKESTHEVRKQFLHG